MLTPDFTHFPTLTTDRLVLRRVRDEDATALFALRSDPEVMRFIEHRRAKKMEDVTALIRTIHELEKKGDAINWSITLKGNDEMMGNICLWQIQREHYRAELGYLLHPELQGKGIMQETISEVLQYGFGTLGLHSVEAQVSPENIASVKRLEQSGFVREGLFRENFCHEGRFSDTAVYSLIDPKAHRS